MLDSSSPPQTLEPVNRAPTSTAGGRALVWGGLCVRWVAGVILLVSAVTFLIWLKEPFYQLLEVLLGSVAIERDTAQQLGRLASGSICLLLGVVGGALLGIGKRMQAKGRLRRHRAAGQRPVVYLRSFADDNTMARRPRAFGRLWAVATEEEQMTAALAELGPVVAIGRPGEALPRLGAERIYLPDDTWQAQVLAWFQRAELVVFQCPAQPTPGVTWEVERAFECVGPTRLAFALPRDPHALGWLRAQLAQRGWPAPSWSVPDRAPYGTRMGGLVHFDGARQPLLEPLRKPPFWRRPYGAPMLPVYRGAFAPLARALGRPLSAPGVAFGDAGVVAFVLAFGGVATAGAMDIRSNMTPLNQAVIQARNAIGSHPAVPERLRVDPDLSEFFEWSSPIVERGMQRLPAEAVMAQLARFRELMSDAGPTDCAALVRGSDQQATALERLLDARGATDPDFLRAWMAFRVAALRAELDADPEPTHRVTQAMLLATAQAFRGAVPASERARFTSFQGLSPETPDSDACWYGRVTLDTILAMPTREGAVVARRFLGQPVEP